ncbi:unnamed protein product [Protopolystoma xenopodis]|uniref:Uncharacterized protein n=1 Tax=Protopolystoma xenopodis TaxID=117903 RepID=A0A3S5AGM9_9PLAT|nr:unnamed protein product [Protopolystoma xenopodis]
MRRLITACTLEASLCLSNLLQSSHLPAKCLADLARFPPAEYAHFDLTLARRWQALSVKSAATETGCLVLHLPDLVGMAFMAATSDNDRLRVAGLLAFQDIIQRFARVADPDCPAPGCHFVA